MESYIHGLSGISLLKLLKIFPPCTSILLINGVDCFIVWWDIRQHRRRSSN